MKFKFLYSIINTIRYEKRCTLCHIPFVQTNHSIKIQQPKINNSLNKKKKLCLQCRYLLQPRTKGYCPSCGELNKDKQSPITPCNNCLKNPPSWEHFYFLNAYEGEYKKLLIQSKFKGNPSITQLLGILLAECCLKLPTPDAIIPMPLHPSRLHKRGFNQCQKLARPVSYALKRPLRHDLLSRVIPTSHQTGLSQTQRLLNIKNAFQADPGVKGLRILLIDDIMTTGTTLQQATKALLKQHTQAIDVCIIARTPSLSLKKV